MNTFVRWMDDHRAWPILSLGLGASLALVLVLSAVFKWPLLRLTADSTLPEDCNDRYALLDARYRCTDVKPAGKEYEAFGDDMTTWLHDLEHKGIITHGAVYFRDLKNGQWFGVEQDETFSPASLLKLPIILAVFKQAEKDPTLLNREIGYEGNLGNYDNALAADQTIQQGQYYTVGELVQRMIVYSDNNSKELLKAVLKGISPDDDLLTRTYVDIGMITEGQKEDNIQMTVKMYASFFRLLYRGTYLNNELSQRALDLLTQTTFSDGLVAGLPTTVRIAHKFGVRENTEDAKQLHDCGIVYHPVNPYLLCVMTRGDDMQKNAGVIADVSRMVYQEVDARAKVVDADVD